MSNIMLDRIIERIAANWVLWREAFNVMVKSPWACVVYNTKGCIPYQLYVVGGYNFILFGVNDDSNQEEAREILGNPLMDPKEENIASRLALYLKALAMVEEGLLEEDFVQELFFGDLSESLEDVDTLFDEEEYLTEE